MLKQHLAFMKNILLLSLLYLSTSNSFADCAGSGVYFWPQTPTIKQNSIIVIECYANSQPIISKLNSTYPIFLKSGDSKIKLNVQEICVGQFLLTQAILVPEETLVAGLEYQLIIENMTDGEALKQWNSTSAKYDLIKWKVESGTDNVKPTWTKKPDEEKKSYVLFGCGPGKNVGFNFAIYDESPVLLKASVTHSKTGKKTSYYLNVSSTTKVMVGHDMCSGAFIYNDGEEYEVSFDILDFSGNSTPWTYDNIKFTAPTVADGY